LIVYSDSNYLLLARDTPEKKLEKNPPPPFVDPFSAS
jgi:hypothetical protein